jgi:hypothetical protein
METGLAVFLILTAFALQIKERARIAAINWSPLIYALCYLTRPETILLAILGFFDFVFFSPKNRKLARLLWFLLIFVLVTGIWFVVAKYNFGSALPNPVLIKAGRSKVIYTYDYVLTRMVLMLFSINAVDFCLILLSIVFLSFLYLFSKSGYRWASILATDTAHYMSVFWIIGVVFSYLLQRVEVSPRYLLLISPLLTFHAVVLLDAAVRSNRVSTVKRNAIIIGVALIYLFESLAATLLIYYPHTDSYNGKDLVLQQIAAWVKNHTEKDASVATIDIGIIGYFSDRRIIDVTGLVNPDIVHAGLTINYLKMKGVKYFLDRHPTPGYLKDHNPHSSKVEYEPILFLDTPSSGWKYGYVEDQHIGFTLYKMHWKENCLSKLCFTMDSAQDRTQNGS